MSPKNNAPSVYIYQIKVTLRDSKPPIWRRILVPGNLSLNKLHDILQIVMGWKDSHAHRFTISEMNYGTPADDQTGALGLIGERRYRIGQFAFREGGRFAYHYDFEAGWEHILLVEKTLLPEANQCYPLCIKGKRACPPEGIGGMRGYDDFLKALTDPEHPQVLEWAGGNFDPEALDLEDRKSVV